MIVMKFGGSSVGTAAAISQVADIVASCRAEKPVIVVSALQGVTDKLIALARNAAQGKTETLGAEFAALRERHEQAIEELFADQRRDEETEPVVEALFGELESAVRGVGCLRELSPRSLDLIVSFGERLSAPIVAAALRRRGLRAVAVDARLIIETDDGFTSAEVRFEETRRKAAAALLPLVESGAVPVVTGFIGATAEGVTTTIGRGGSDYTAAILGGALGAREVWIWKEVDGVMTADPGAVPEAALLSAISYDEAAEMSYFGAKVLHPKTMIPVIAQGIPIRMRNTFRPGAPGTVIGPISSSSPSGVKVVTAIKKLAMVTVAGKGMMGISGFAAHVFGTAGRGKINVLMFSQSSSEQNICLVIGSKDGPAFKAALQKELREALLSRLVDEIAVEDGVAAVAVVGEGMKGTPGIAAKVFTAAARGKINVLAIAQGSSERNISFIVREADADEAVRAVHEEFRLNELRLPQPAAV